VAIWSQVDSAISDLNRTVRTARTHADACMVPYDGYPNSACLAHQAGFWTAHIAHFESEVAAAAARANAGTITIST